MGLLDRFANLDETQTQGLLAAASNMLQNSGPSRTPVGFGQIVGGGLEAYQGSTLAAKKRKAEEEHAKQLAAYRGMQMQEMQGNLQDSEHKRQEAMDLEALQKGYPGARAQQPPQIQLSSVPQNSTMGQPTAPPTMGEYEQAMDYAQYLKANGKVQMALKVAADAQKLKPEFDQTPRVGNDANGKPITYVLDKSGNKRIIDGVAPREEIKLMDNGMSMTAYNPHEIKPGQSFQRFATPGERLVSARASEANGIAARAAGVSLSTGLRKEFDGLDEVKNYKMAVPAFSAIVDASKRNTPMADINLVYGIAKLYDPTSVVREGEYNTIANSPNIPERFKGYAQYLAGGGKLSPEVKAQIVREAQGRMTSYEGQFTAARKNYEDIAGRSGGDPSLVFPSPYKSPIASSNPKPAPKSLLKGQVVDGYRYKGGDKSKPENWEKV